MPLTMRGSVSARLSVRFSTLSACRNVSRSAANTSIPGIDRFERRVAAQHEQRRAPFGAGFREHERAGGKIERCEIVAPAELCVRRPPMQSSGDHQMEHEPQVVVEADRDALADAPQLAHGASLHARERRVGGAQQEDARDAYPFERLTDDTCSSALMYAAMSGSSGMGCAFYLRTFECL